jgi:hypothetical protein
VSELTESVFPVNATVLEKLAGPDTPRTLPMKTDFATPIPPETTRAPEVELVASVVVEMITEESVESGPAHTIPPPAYILFVIPKPPATATDPVLPLTASSVDEMLKCVDVKPPDP